MLTGTALAAGLVTASGVVGIANQAYELVIRCITIPVRDLKPALDGFRIVQMTDFHDMWLYTNGGIGTISVPYRYNCPPEVTEFTLVIAKAR